MLYFGVVIYPVKIYIPLFVLVKLYDPTQTLPGLFPSHLINWYIYKAGPHGLSKLPGLSTFLSRYVNSCPQSEAPVINHKWKNAQIDGKWIQKRDHEQVNHYEV